MLRITIPKSDLSKSMPVDGGWQQFTLGKPYTKTSKDQQSVNYIIPHILDNDVNGRVIEHMFNSKAMGMMAGFIAALANKTVPEVLEAMQADVLDFDLESVEGQKILGKVVHEDYQGRAQSKISMWANPANVPF